MQDEYNAKLNLIKKYMLDLKSMSDSSTVLEATENTHSNFATLFMEVNANVYHTNQKIACMKLLINKIKELRNELRLMREHM